MRKIFIPIIILLIHLQGYAQQNMTDYNKLWKKVDDLVQKSGLTATALQEVRKIHALAVKEKNNGQLLKALVYEGQLSTVNEEDAVQKTINSWNIELKNSKEPITSLLHSLIATSYWNYFQQNRYKLYGRSPESGVGGQESNTKEIESLSSQELHALISKHYLASVSNPDLLLATKLAAYEPIIIKGNTPGLRPTLYDLLAHTALSYFTTPERTIQKAINDFEISDLKAFATAADFILWKPATSDTTSLYLKAIEIYQDLLRIHLKDANPAALINIDLDRLEFINRYATLPEKNELYIDALKKIVAGNSRNPLVSVAAFQIASTIYAEAMKYDEENPVQQLRYLLVDVKTQLDAIIKNYPKSEGAANAENLLRQIVRKSLQMETEKVNLPDQPFRSRISFSNTNLMYYRIIRVDDQFPDNNSRHYDDSYWKQLVAMKPIKQVKQELPLAEDFRLHAVEIKIDALPVGRYVLLAGLTEDFSLKENPMAVQYFYVSDIAWVNKDSHYFFLHRETGLPLTDANVQLWNKSYDYTTRKQILTKLQQLVVRKDGYVNIPDSKDQNSQLAFEVKWQQDRIFPEDAVIRTYPVYRDPSNINVDEEKKYSRAFLFTDRGIYRPGQEIFFKAIYIRKNKTDIRSTVINQLKSKIFLKDVNDQVVDSIIVESNDFGSVSGKFRLPMQGLTGSFTIIDEYTGSAQSIQVEEYKRPKFQVEIIQPKTEFRVNDSVTISGIATAYAGNPISGSKMSYRVTRIANFPYPMYGRLRFMPYSQPVEIANGISQTGEDGKFNIAFKAAPDKNTNPDLLPVFQYNIIADITDINGETRTGETTVSIGYHSLQIAAIIPAIIYSDSLNAMKISATNLSGETQKTAFRATVYSLETPDRLIRQRYWSAPDTFIFSKTEYLKYFPLDEYKNESEKENWARKEKVWELTDTVNGKDQPFAIPNGRLKSGMYVIEISALDKTGKEVKTLIYTELRSKIGGAGVVPQFYQAALNKSSYQPGETAKQDLRTNADNLYIIRQIQSIAAEEEENDDSRKLPFVYDVLRLNKETRVFDYAVTESERGGFGVFQVFIKHNRLFIEESVIAVPWVNKELNIQFTTFRDKTLPGSKEEWAIQVKGNKGEKLAAEMLTSMYDLSLDQFLMYQWRKPQIYPNYNTPYYRSWNRNGYFSEINSEFRNVPEIGWETNVKTYDRLLWSDNGINDVVVVGYGTRRKQAAMGNAAAPMADVMLESRASGVVMEKVQSDSIAFRMDNKPGNENTNQQNPIRSDFRETAFFFPDLKTDADGNVKFSFTMPEALTEWKWQLFAHTQDLSMGLNSKTVITQKELMVQPNLPRFLREGDKLTVAVKVVNLTAAELTGQSTLQLIDAESGQVVDGLFTNVFPVQYFTAPANGSVPVEFTMTIPYSFNKPLICRITAKAGTHEDGEEIALPVLTNRMLITESLPIRMIGTGTKTFSFDKLLQSGKSPSLTNHALTVEYSSNPAWYAVQALPYLTQFPYACAEQEFNRFYANALSSMIAVKHPKIKAWFEKRLKDSAEGKQVTFISNLEKNQELKNILLEETPWVLDAKNEANQQKQIAQLFDLVRISGDLESSLTKFKQAQTDNGGFTWFPGGREDRFITQYIVTGIGRLMKLGAVPVAQQQSVNEIARKGLSYLSQEALRDYVEIAKKKAQMTSYIPDDLNIQYLYTLSFFPEFKPDAKTTTAIQYFRAQAKKSWVKKSRLTQAMIALAAHRSKDVTTSRAILAALKEQSVNSETLGRYWKEVQYGYYWYQAPVETQALMIEAFDEISDDQSMVAGLKQWLLLQKQTQNWKTTKATADACYALLLRGSDWLAADPDVKISLGETNPVVFDNSISHETGTGYFKSVIDGREVKPDLGKIKIDVSNAPTNEKAQLSWGAVYWQYFENLDNITTASTPLSIKKTWFVERQSEKGPVLSQVEEGTVLKPGDKLKVRLELRSDRMMEYIHVKDQRASGTEPVDVISGYHWQGGLGYYQSTRDASTNFFISYLPKGTYVFEYALFVNQQGNFSAGPTVAQCMYAPEFSAHSEGVRIKVAGR